MKTKLVLTVLVAVMTALTAGCQTSTEDGPPPTPTPVVSLTILSPGPSASVDPGQAVSFQIQAKDESGVGRVELWVDDVVADSATVPSGTPAQTYEAFLFWTATAGGAHKVEVKAFSTDGQARTSVRQAIQVSDNPAAVQVVAASPRSAPRTAAPRPTAPQVGSINIRHFRASVSEARPGDTITLEWDAPGATRGFLYVTDANGQTVPPRQVLAKGTLDYPLAPSEKGTLRFTLSVLNNDGRQMERSVSVAVSGSAPSDGAVIGGGGGGCRDWFFAPPPDECGRSAIKSPGAQEHFEHGVMIWVQELKTIYVLYDDEMGRQWETHVDDFNPDVPESDPRLKSPDGLHQPVRGFGLLWRTNTRLRERIGWALDLEVGAPTAVQSTARGGGDTTFLKNLYSGVYRLEPDGSWEFIPEDVPAPSTEPDSLG